jgi:hypothetical protein
MLEVLSAEEPALQVATEQEVQQVESNGSRFIDFFVQLGQKSALLEVKYGIPNSAEAYDRLLSQLNAAVSSGQAQQVVLVLVRPPTAAQLVTLAQNLGTSAEGVTAVTLDGLYIWLQQYFGVYF